MKKIVIKIGSSVIAPQGELDYRFLRGLASQIKTLRKEGFVVVLVSSGAIALGRPLLGVTLKDRLSLNQLQAAASLGQIKLMDVYNRIFSRLKINCAQLLLTWDDFEKRNRYINISHTLNVLFKRGILPIANENDVVSTDEIKFGDNDKLSALLASLISAGKLVILSDVKGFLKEGQLVRRIENINGELLRFARGSSSIWTKGGMRSKLEAARIATSSGVSTFIAKGQTPGIILQIVRGEDFEGTSFVPAMRISARRRWIAFARKSRGVLYIDEGAGEAIVNNKKSLLAVGVKKVEGDFAKGDSVAVKNNKGRILGYGLTNFSASELKKNLGKKLEKEVIHRDNLAIVKQNGQT